METLLPLVTSLCGRQDLNLHVFRHQDLNLARLPISPHPRASLLRAYRSARNPGWGFVASRIVISGRGNHARRVMRDGDARVVG